VKAIPKPRHLLQAKKSLAQAFPEEKTRLQRGMAFEGNRDRTVSQSALQRKINQSSFIVSQQKRLSSAFGVSMLMPSQKSPIQRVPWLGGGRDGDKDGDNSIKGSASGASDFVGAYAGTAKVGPGYGPEENTGDFRIGGAGKAPSSQKGIDGSEVAIGGGAGAVVANTYGLYKGVKGFKEANKKRKKASNDLDALGGDESLYAEKSLLNKEKKGAKHDQVESGVQVGTSFNGFVNGVTTAWNNIATSTGVAGVSAVTFGAGAGLNALIGTINGVRDSLNADKRRKQKGATATLLSFAKDRLNEYRKMLIREKIKLSSENRDLSNLKHQMRKEEIKKSDKQNKLYFLEGEIRRPQLPRDHPDKVAEDFLISFDEYRRSFYSENKVTALKDEIKAHDNAIRKLLPKIKKIEIKIKKAEDTIQAEYQESIKPVLKLISGLQVSKRKQGYKEKAGTASLNFMGAAGGAALLAATIGGVAAAATPIGWTLAGLAAVGILIYTVGKKVKRKIRKSNVKRMKAERDLILYDLEWNNVQKGSRWNRREFKLREERGQFNKFGRRKKSGKITIEKRLAEIDTYLKKYDVESAGDEVYEGVKSALKGEQGDHVVNVGGDQDLPLKGAVEEFLRSLQIDPKGILDSMDGGKAAKAKALLRNKMKL